MKRYLVALVLLMSSCASAKERAVVAVDDTWESEEAACMARQKVVAAKALNYELDASDTYAQLAVIRSQCNIATDALRALRLGLSQDGGL